MMWLKLILAFFAIEESLAVVGAWAQRKRPSTEGAVILAALITALLWAYGVFD